jgi:hypothetical protein
MYEKALYFIYVVVRHLLTYGRYRDDRLNLYVYAGWIGFSYLILVTGSIALDVTTQSLRGLGMNISLVKTLVLLGADLLSTLWVRNKIKVINIESVLSFEFFRAMAFGLLLFLVIFGMQILLWAKVTSLVI